MRRHLHHNLPHCHCLSRPDLLDYPIPPVPAHAVCNYAMSPDYIPGNAHPSPPVEHEYHSIDVNYKRVTYAAAEPRVAHRLNGSARLAADCKYVLCCSGARHAHHQHECQINLLNVRLTKFIRHAKQTVWKGVGKRENILFAPHIFTLFSDILAGFLWWMNSSYRGLW